MAKTRVAMVQMSLSARAATVPPKPRVTTTVLPVGVTAEEIWTKSRVRSFISTCPFQQVVDGVARAIVEGESRIPSQQVTGIGVNALGGGIALKPACKGMHSPGRWFSNTLYHFRLENQSKISQRGFFFA